ncbi:MAG: sedoheptulose 7-phosphate cyclase [Methanomassiliicoccales archaeon]
MVVISTNSHHKGENDISSSGYNKKITATNKLDYSYDVIFTDDDMLSPRNPILGDALKDRKCFVVMSKRVSELYGERVRHYLSHWLEDDKFRIMTIAVTERTKNIETVMQICSEAKRFKLDRRSLFVAIGGGVLTDCVGLASSIYMRKLSYIRIPTTLVGQIDAGIGLKTGVDFEESKNFIGTFHPPIFVFNDARFLRTLGPAEIRDGLAEIIKMALVSDAELFSTVEKNKERIIDCYLTGSDEALIQRVNILAANRMLEQLQENPYEMRLERLVDFGHTFSPFIEMHTQHRISHGQAVAMDMAISTEISRLLRRTDDAYHDRILSLIADLGLELYDKEAFDIDGMWKSLESVILRRGGRLNLVIPARPGKAEFLHEAHELELKILREACENLSRLQNGRW